MGRKTLRWPLRLTARGGAATTSRTLEAQIGISLLPGRSANPFEVRDGLVPPDHVWSGPGAEAAAAAHVRDRFRQLERQRRARLEGDPVVRLDNDGLLGVEAMWEDLESGETDETQVATS